jgi:hypothetical protein
MVTAPSAESPAWHAPISGADKGHSRTIDRSPAIPEGPPPNLLRAAALGPVVVGTGASSVIFGATGAEATATFVPKGHDLHLLVPGVGFEPTRSQEQQGLGLPRLPFRHPG